MRKPTSSELAILILLLGVGYYAVKPSAPPPAPEPVEQVEAPPPVPEKIETPPPEPKVEAKAEPPAAPKEPENPTGAPTDSELSEIAVLGGEEPPVDTSIDWELSSDTLDDLVDTLENNENGALLEFRRRFHLSNAQLVDIKRLVQIKKRRMEDSDGQDETVEQIQEDFRTGILDVLGR